MELVQIVVGIDNPYPDLKSRLDEATTETEKVAVGLSFLTHPDFKFTVAEDGLYVIVQQNLVSLPNIFSFLLPKPLAEQLVNLSQVSRKSRNWVSPFSLGQIVEDDFCFYRQFSLRVEVSA